jgi:streptomycin 3"-adenylyltransferase
VITVPAEAQRAIPVLERHLGDTLVAIYLHGSAVGGGLRPRSDVDILAVVDRPTTPDNRARLVADLLEISGIYPAPPGAARPIELTIVLLSDLQPAPYPARIEFMYGEWLRADFETGGSVDPSVSAGHTLLLAQARREAKALQGPALPELLHPIPDADIRRAFAGALTDLVPELVGDERNVLLTLARMWYTLTTGDFVAKDVAANWAAAQLPAGPAAMLAMARGGYLGTVTDEWHGRESETAELAGLLARQIKAVL